MANEEWLTRMTGDTLCTLCPDSCRAQDKFEAQEEKRVWGQLSEEQAEPVVMQALLEKAAMKKKSNKSLNSSDGETQKEEKQAR